jgi:hypothetical protein
LPTSSRCPEGSRRGGLEQRALLTLGRIKQPGDFSQGLNMALVEKAMHEMPQFFADLKPVR